jgi:hypothetical protein
MGGISPSAATYRTTQNKYSLEWDSNCYPSVGEDENSSYLIPRGQPRLASTIKVDSDDEASLLLKTHLTHGDKGLTGIASAEPICSGTRRPQTTFPKGSDLGVHHSQLPGFGLYPSSDIGPS